jgi:hypothetical protein
MVVWSQVLGQNIMATGECGGGSSSPAGGQEARREEGTRRPVIAFKELPP